MKKDINNFLSALIPKGGRLGYSFKHSEGISDSHIKSSLTGPALELIIHDNELILGTWQCIMFVNTMDHGIEEFIYKFKDNKQVIVELIKFYSILDLLDLN